MSEATPRTYTAGSEIRCDECCTGDRCDDPTHRDRRHCPYCKGTGHIGWLTKPQFERHQPQSRRGAAQGEE